MPPGCFSQVSPLKKTSQICSIRIYNYLINFTSSYSGDSLKAYKSLEGYKWTQSGFVTNIQMWNLQAKKCCIITGRVSVQV